MFNRKSIYILWGGFLTILICLFSYQSCLNTYPSSVPSLTNTNIQKIRILNNRTTEILHQLVKTKFFKIIRLNINSQCTLSQMNKLCKSKSCSVCRCDQKDIPQNWIKTDKIASQYHFTKGKQIWSNERQQTSSEWIWHVQDLQNDRGQYFDVNFNIESYSGYNGSYIWSLIYEQNCFKGRHNYQQMCREQKLLYQIISGLHTSISTHLSRYFRNITQVPEWADVSSDQSFFFNHEQYVQRVLKHPQRLQNLMFLYELLIRSVREIVPYLSKLTISSENIAQDLKATRLLEQFIQQVKENGLDLGNLQKKNYGMFSNNQTSSKGYLKNYLDDNHVKQYQNYIHNISRILNCVQCQKCRLFGKMQTYGLGTAMKILLGYDEQLKRNQLVAMINTLNKISLSVNTYFQYNTKLNLQEQKDNKFLLTKIFSACGLVFLVFIQIAVSSKGTQNLNKKLDKVFKNSNKFKKI